MLTLLLGLAQLQRTPVDVTLTVDGTERKAVIYKSTAASKTNPVVFVWHGFTGNAKQAAFSYRVHEAWPEATVVYPQGLDVELLGRKAPGWQIAPKMAESRDVKFYDALLAKVKSDYGADPKRVYTCGMSNGAIFSYVLLCDRANTLAAAAPVAGYAAPAFKGAIATPVLIIHGKTDPLIRLQAAEKSRDAAVENNKASTTTKEWQKGYDLYAGPKGMDVIWHVHEGGHTWPKDVTESIVKFFKTHAR